MRKLVFVTLCVLVAASVSLADWNVGDPYKMHYAQLPDPNGWDIGPWNSHDPPPPYRLLPVADDWRCTETGPVTDIHTWYSWKGGVVGAITEFEAHIYADIPASQNPDGYSKPALTQLWAGRWVPGDPVASTMRVTTRWYGTGDQGWYDPIGPQGVPQVIPHDHQDYYQLNIDNIKFPFVQQAGTIYWVDFEFYTEGGQAGVKTSLQHYQDDAVYLSLVPQPVYYKWNELRDPQTQQSLDLAFVITPEPTTLGLLLFGGLALLRRRK